QGGRRVLRTLVDPVLLFTRVHWKRRDAQNTHQQQLLHIRDSNSLLVSSTSYANAAAAGRRNQDDRGHLNKSERCLVVFYPPPLTAEQDGHTNQTDDRQIWTKHARLKRGGHIATFRRKNRLSDRPITGFSVPCSVDSLFSVPFQTSAA